MPEDRTAIIQLPLSVVGRIDLGRLIREVDALENYLEGAAVREPEVAPKMPKTSRLMDEVLQQNRLDPLSKADRNRLREFLESVRTEAPLLHMSFSADPSPLFTQKLIAWLRQEIHPVVLLQVGLQPTIGAGSIVRTTNKQFDFSLRARLKEKREILINKLHQITEKTLESPEPITVELPPVAAVTPIPPLAVAPTAPEPAPVSSPQPVPASVSGIQPIKPVTPIAPMEKES